MKTLCMMVPFLLLFANAALACPACYGKSDSPMAQGMNAGIYALLAVVGTVLFASATFFVFLARRASQVSKDATNLEQ